MNNYHHALKAAGLSQGRRRGPHRLPRRGGRALVAADARAVFAYQRLDELPAGGRTPLAAELRLARFEIERQRRKRANLRPFLVLVTDGRATLPEPGALDAACAESDRLREHRIESLVIDTETDWLRLGQARRLAERLGASYHHITRLPPKSWGQAVREWIARSGAGPASSRRASHRRTRASCGC